MPIHLYNTLSGKLEEFKPVKKGVVSMYHCGPTVYNRAHLGNMRPYVFADVLRRFFEYHGFEVNQVINITDVGHLTDDGDDGIDKVEKSAKEQKKTAKEITEDYTNKFFNDLDLLNIDKSKIKFPKATEHIEEQIEMIKQLEVKGFTYRISDGIYFDTSKFKDYGKLGNIKIDQLKEGARVEKNKEKKNPTDFALWKFSKPEENRQQEWPSPWGTGFPGWHIECSAMSKKYLGETFDIHTGGIEHIPTHHNNEIAQSESITNKPQANYWLHHNHILIENQKISKSLGNTLFLEDLEKEDISPLAYRYWLLTGEYRTLMNFSWQSGMAAQKAYQRLIRILVSSPDNGVIEKKYQEKFIEYLDDNLNTASAISVIWDLIKDSSVKDEDKKTTIFNFDKIFGLNLEAVSNLAKKLQENTPENIKKMAEERELARKAKNFQKADILRDMIEEDGYSVKDTEEGFEISPLFTNY
jgi:cysteinyl-tRNA synthetase